MWKKESKRKNTTFSLEPLFPRKFVKYTWTQLISYQIINKKIFYAQNAKWNFFHFQENRLWIHFVRSCIDTRVFDKSSNFRLFQKRGILHKNFILHFSLTFARRTLLIILFWHVQTWSWLNSGTLDFLEDEGFNENILFSLFFFSFT